MKPAANLDEAASADNSLEGYAAINGMDDRDEIARLAYQYYEERGDGAGSAEEDWLRAEREVRARREQAAERTRTAGGS
jgi:hypothetical protein